MAVKKDLCFVSNIDALKIHFDVYEPKNSNGIIIQAMHGMAEHKARYEALGTYLANKGYTFVISAHRGHKGAVLSKDDYGYMGEDGLNSARDDAYQLTKLLKENYPNHKMILFGHSMGSLIARLYFQKYADELDGLILCGSPAANPIAKAGLIICNIIKKLFGAKYRSKLLNAMSFGSYNAHFEKRTEFDWLSVNKQNVDDYIEDEACGYIFTAQSFKDLIQGIVDVYSTYPKPLKNMNCPVLFIAGSEDPCGEYGAGVLKAREHMLNQGVRKVDVKLYENLRHEILNEENSEVIIDDMIEFITNNVMPKA